MVRDKQAGRQKNEGPVVATTTSDTSRSTRKGSVVQRCRCLVSILLPLQLFVCLFVFVWLEQTRKQQYFGVDSIRFGPPLRPSTHNIHNIPYRTYLGSSSHHHHCCCHHHRRCHGQGESSTVPGQARIERTDASSTDETHAATDPGRANPASSSFPPVSWVVVVAVVVAVVVGTRVSEWCA